MKPQCSVQPGNQQEIEDIYRPKCYLHISSHHIKSPKDFIHRQPTKTGWWLSTSETCILFWIEILVVGPIFMRNKHFEYKRSSVALLSQLPGQQALGNYFISRCYKIKYRKRSLLSLLSVYWKPNKEKRLKRYEETTKSYPDLLICSAWCDAADLGAVLKFDEVLLAGVWNSLTKSCFLLRLLVSGQSWGTDTAVYPASY